MPSKTITAEAIHRDRLASAWCRASVAAQRLATDASVMVSTFNRGNTPTEGQTRDVEGAMADLLDAMATIKTEQGALDAIGRSNP